MDWKAKDIPMSNFGRDLIRALGERPTVFQPNVLDAVAQFEDILEKYLTS